MTLISHKQYDLPQYQVFNLHCEEIREWHYGQFYDICLELAVKHRLCFGSYEEDVASHVAEMLWRRIESRKPLKKAVSWCKRLTANEWMDRHRASRTREKYELTLGAKRPSVYYDDPAVNLEVEEFVDSVKQRTMKQVAVYLIFFGLDYGEIAGLLGISVGYAKRCGLRLQRRWEEEASSSSGNC